MTSNQLQFVAAAAGAEQSPPPSPSSSLGSGAESPKSPRAVAPKEPTFDPTGGGLRHFKGGKLPWAQPSWLILSGVVHTLTTFMEYFVIAYTWICGAYSQDAYFDATLQVDFDPGDTIVVDPEAWKNAAITDLCYFITCEDQFVSMNLVRVRNITRSRSGIVLLQGIEQIFIRVSNPTVWGLPALATQRRSMEVIMKNPTGAIYDPPYGRFTNGGAGTLMITQGDLDPLSPSFEFILVALAIVVIAAFFNTCFVCFCDPDTAEDPYPEGWEVEGLDDEDFGSALFAVPIKKKKNKKAKKKKKKKKKGGGKKEMDDSGEETSLRASDDESTIRGSENSVEDEDVEEADESDDGEVDELEEEEDDDETSSSEDDEETTIITLTPAETRRRALYAARKREAEIVKEADIRKRDKLRRRRGCMACCCPCCLVLLFVKVSFRDTKESWMLVFTRMSTTMLQSLPLVTMYLWLSFSTPRGMADGIFFCVVAQMFSIALAALMWERSALRTENNLVIRLLHPAVLRLTGARLLELTSNIGIFALFTSQYGTISIGVLISLDILAVISIVMGTWYYQGRTLAGSSHSLVGAFRRALLALPVLLGLHWDHIPGRVGNTNSVADPRAYYAWRIGRHGLLTTAVLVNIKAMTDMTSGGWYGIGFAIVTISAGLLFPLLNASYWAYQDMIDLPPVGLRMPLPKRCQRELAEGELERGNLAANTSKQVDDRDNNRQTLMALYGSKASDMENEGKKAKAEHARIEALKKAGKWPPKTTKQQDNVEANVHDKDPFEGKVVVLNGVDVDRVMELTRQLMSETEPQCHGCEGLSLIHDEHLCKLNPRERYLSGKKSKLKERHRLPEPSAEARSRRVREHVEFAQPPPSLSETANRLSRATESPKRTGGDSVSKYLVLKQHVPLSEQAASIPGRHLF